MKTPKIMDRAQRARLELAIRTADADLDAGSLRELAWTLGDLRRVGVCYRSGSEIVLRGRCEAIGLDPDPLLKRMYAAMGAWPSGVESTPPGDP